MFIPTAYRYLPTVIYRRVLFSLIITAYKLTLYYRRTGLRSSSYSLRARVSRFTAIQTQTLLSRSLQIGTTYSRACLNAYIRYRGIQDSRRGNRQSRSLLQKGIQRLIYSFGRYRHIDINVYSYFLIVVGIEDRVCIQFVPIPGIGERFSPKQKVYTLISGSGHKPSTQG